MEVNSVKQNEKARQEYSFLFNRYPDHILKEIKKAKKVRRRKRNTTGNKASKYGNGLCYEEKRL